jgi:hypothetical protein
MTPLGLTVLRRTATLVHAVPGLRVRLRHDGKALLEVLRPAHPVVAPSGRWVTPCGFRTAVARALQAYRDGRTLAVLGLDAGVDPAVDVGAPNGRLLPGGVAIVPTVDGCEMAFATTIAPDVVAGLDHGGLDVRCHPDPLTEACLIVHAGHHAPGSAAAAVELLRLQALVAQCAVQELVDDRDGFLGVVTRPHTAEHPRDRPPRS